MDSRIAIMIVIAWFCRRTHGDNCNMDIMGMKQTVELCLITTEAIGYLNSNESLKIADACDNIVQPMISCLEPNITGCAEELELPMNVSDIRERATKICSGLQVFMNPQSTHGCNIERLSSMTCVKESELLQPDKIIEQSVIQGIDFFCNGWLDDILTCIEDEITVCGDLFGISTNLTWLRNIVSEGCRFLTKEPNCDLLQMAYIGYSSYVNTLAMLKKNGQGLFDSSPLPCAPAFTSGIFSGIIDHLEPNIAACGQMFDMTTSTKNLKDTMKLLCSYRKDLENPPECVEELQALETCGQQEVNVPYESHIKYFTELMGMTIESAISNISCRFFETAENCVTSTIAKCDDIKEIGAKALAIAVPNSCTPKNNKKVGDKGGGESITLSAFLVMINLFATTGIF